MPSLGSGRMSSWPPIVKNLIIINVLLAVLQYLLWHSAKINLADYLGLHFWQSELYKPWQLITHMFMHGDPRDVEGTIMHLFSNMFGLWMFGGILENTWGSKRFFTFYMICGLGAALCHLGVLAYEFHSFDRAFSHYQEHATAGQFALFVQQHHLDRIPEFTNLQSFWLKNSSCGNCSMLSVDLINQYQTLHLNEATVGASGAVFGVLFAFGYLFPNTPLMMIFVPIPIKAKYFIAFYAIFELYAGIRNSAGDNVAHFAHLGGMVFAFIILKIWSRNRNRFY